MSHGGGSILERTDQLATLTALWHEAVSGSGRIAVIGGEAGAGKTTLVRHFCGTAVGTAIVLGGAGDALHTARPLGPFQDIASRACALGKAIERGARPFEVASALLTDFARLAPAVLVLEDLHWADEASLDVVRLLVRRLDDHPVLVIVTYRDDELGSTHALRLLLGELSTSLVRLRVPPLSVAAVAELAAPLGVNAEQLHTSTGGNPFFVTEVLAGAGSTIPDSVRDAVHARVARLSPAGRALLETVAVVPQHSELWLLDSVAPDHGDALDECIAAGILHASRGYVRFRHELARLAVEESVAAGRRRALHQRLLPALAAPPDGRRDVARLAHHAEAAGDGPAVVQYARDAAREAAAVGAHREAAAQYALVLRNTAYVEPGELADVYTAHSRECYLADDGEQAISSADAAVTAHHAAGQPLREADAFVWLSSVQRMNGRPAAARASMSQALRILDGAPTGVELARAYAAAALAAMSSGDAADAFSAGERAMRIAEQLGDEETYVHALISVGTMEMEAADRYSSGRDKLVRSIDLATSLGAHELVGRAYNNLAYEAFAHHDLPAAEDAVRAAIAHAGANGVDVWLHVSLGSLAEIQLARGAWDEAVDTIGQVLDRAATAIPRMGPLTVLGLIRARRGDPDPWGPLDEAYDIASDSGELQMIVPVAAARAEAAWLEGRCDDVRAASEAIVRRATTAGQLWALPDLLYWRRLAGADDAIPTLRDSPRSTQLAGRTEIAAQRWATLGYPYEAALALAESDDEAALRDALRQLQQLGATATAAVVARRLRERGARSIPRGPRPSTASNPALLTRREVEVVALLAAGLPNAEIAQRLFLSEKTVGHHVSAVLRKLGVDSRTRAAHEAVRRGIVAQPN